MTAGAVSGGEAGRLGRVLTPDDVQAIGLLDLQQLARENAGGGFQADAPLYGVLNCLRMWENLILRMEEGWRRQDYYMVYEYLNILTVRNGIEDFLDAMSPDLRAKVGRCVERLDARYRAVTYDDGGEELAGYWRPLADGREVRWWWTRCPAEFPPGW